MTVNNIPEYARQIPATSRPGKELGRRLRYLRAQLGISQLEMAQRNGMGRSYISKIENGKILPRYDTLLRIAAGFGIEVAELLHRSSSKSRAASEPDQTHP